MSDDCGNFHAGDLGVQIQIPIVQGKPNATTVFDLSPSGYTANITIKMGSNTAYTKTATILSPAAGIVGYTFNLLSDNVTPELQNGLLQYQVDIINSGLLVHSQIGQMEVGSILT